MELSLHQKYDLNTYVDGISRDYMMEVTGKYYSFDRDCIEYELHFYPKWKAQDFHLCYRQTEIDKSINNHKWLIRPYVKTVPLEEELFVI